MKKVPFLFLILAVMVLGCQKKSEPQKMINGLPTNTSKVVLPAAAAQQYLLVIDDVCLSVINFLNRLGTYTSPTFPELTSIGGDQYSFDLSNPKYGTATAVIQFFNGGTSINPIATLSSSNTVTHVNINVNTGVSSLFTYSHNIVMTLQTAGILTSDKTVTGTASMNGSNHALTFNIDSSGCKAVLSGFISGKVNVTGTGIASAPVTMSLNFDLDNFANGTILWESQEGQIHFDQNANGIIITNQERILVP